MQENAKISASKKAESLLRKSSQLYDVETKSDESSFTVTGRLAENCSVKYDFKILAGLLILRAEITLPGVSGSDLNETAAEITEGTDYRSSCYDDKIIIQKVVSCADLDDREGEEKIMSSTKSFMSNLFKRKSKFAKGDTNENETKMIETSNDEKYNDDLDMAFADDYDDDDLVFTTPPASADEAAEPDPVSEPVQETNADDEMLDLLLGSLSKKSDKKEKKETPKNEEESADASKEKNEKTESGAGKNTELNDANAEPVYESSPTDTGDGDDKKEKAAAAEASPELSVPKNTVGYVRAPEVQQQMTELYAEVDAAFEARKKYADRREQSLNDLAEKLSKREDALKAAADRHEAEYQQKCDEFEKECEKRKADIQVQHDQIMSDIQKEKDSLEHQQKDIDFKWKKIYMEQETLESRKKDLENEKALMAKEMEFCIDKNEAQKLIEENRTLKAEAEEKAKALEAAAANASATDLKEVEELKSQVNDLEADVEKRDKIIALFTKRRADWENEKKQMQSDISRLKSARDSSAGVSQQNEEQIEQLESEASGLRRSLNEARSENKTMQRSLSSVRDLLTESQKKIDTLERKVQAAAAASRSKNDGKSADEAIKELESIGIDAKKADGEADDIIMGLDGDIRVIVNLTASVLYEEKILKNGRRYASEITEWNTEDIRSSYMLTRGARSIVCKYTYDDLAEAVMTVSEKFKGLK